MMGKLVPEFIRVLFKKLRRYFRLGPDDIILVDSVPEENKLAAQTQKLQRGLPQENRLAVQIQKSYGLPPPIFLKKSELPDDHLILSPQFPMTEREIVQAWYDIKTIVCRCQLGNTARLLLLIDREGSMTPFHSFVESVSSAIQTSGNLDSVAVYYFHDVPVEGVNPVKLNIPQNQMVPGLDSVLPEIEPLRKGVLFKDKQLSNSVDIDKVLNKYECASAVVLISDAGAARGKYDIHRLLNTIAFLKGVREYSKRIVWLNPLPENYWKKSIKVNNNNTATHISRHVPMFSLDRAGIYKAINILCGQPYDVKRPL
ncbi:MAG: hypothetical protein GY795_02720 [Desulfobacterales bacterium]|nr:hypothetical protein [Desulfobacterales bacterium]